ncbi:PAP2-domain-containing protein [Saitoella complicata NRRL Y-17804]|uniref:PAP2-domain-containing protein n=1 Tax=Saitoella complicata (strain BCRC 22490 / CBS 7301 / JCM 7358 / NBRC 10748 / NRRL Y-17804) TaxID=698492 RepID=UPI00086822D8|nr:PAP2-domain-containing protein [Saitoella complicata NRRL Y-17804]ODQ49882.1 PAP2-domain-containing protein [Saitoella complicata NRRL Y-17804]
MDHLKAHTNCPPAPYVSLSLTHVSYDASSPYSLPLAYLTLTPLLLLIIYSTLFLSTRQFLILVALAGQLVNEAINYVLKKLLKEARPVLPGLDEAVGKGYGMPSSHSQFMGFWAGVVVVVLYGKLGHRYTAPQRIALSVAAVTLSTLVCVSRVVLGYHSIKQVVVGNSLGYVLASVWWFAVQELQRWGVSGWVLQLWPMKLMYVKDMFGEGPGLKEEWQRWRASGAKKGQ